MEFLRSFFPNTGVEAVLDLIFTNNFFLLINKIKIELSSAIRMMEQWNNGMMQDWDNGQIIYFLPIIPQFQHSIIPCGRHKTSVIKKKLHDLNVL